MLEKPGVAGIPHRYTPARAIWPCIRRSVGATPADHAMHGPRIGGGARRLPRCRGRGNRRRTPGSVREVGCSACPGGRDIEPRPRRHRSQHRQSVAACGAAGRCAVSVFVSGSLAGAKHFRLAVGKQLFFIAGVYQSGWKYPTGAHQIAQPAQELSWRLSGPRPGCPGRRIRIGPRAAPPRAPGLRATVRAARHGDTGCWSALS